MAKKPKIERFESTLLRAAVAFCDADRRVQEARRRWKVLKDAHDPLDGVCALEGLPQKDWCSVCWEYANNPGPCYADALEDRRRAKTRMKRAFKNLEEAGKDEQLDDF